ncbi:hypothetical protein HDU99_006498, partial [Rhizoclosmatium hyalinum]
MDPYDPLYDFLIDPAASCGPSDMEELYNPLGINIPSGGNRARAYSVSNSLSMGLSAIGLASPQNTPGSSAPVQHSFSRPGPFMPTLVEGQVNNAFANEGHGGLSFNQNFDSMQQQQQQPFTPVTSFGAFGNNAYGEVQSQQSLLQPQAQAFIGHQPKPNSHSLGSAPIAHGTIDQQMDELNEFIKSASSSFTSLPVRYNSIPAWVYNRNSTASSVPPTLTTNTPSPMGNGYTPDATRDSFESIYSSSSPAGHFVQSSSPAASPLSYGTSPQFPPRYQQQPTPFAMHAPTPAQSTSPPYIPLSNNAEQSVSSQAIDIPLRQESCLPTPTGPSRKRRNTAHLRLSGAILKSRTMGPKQQDLQDPSHPSIFSSSAPHQPSYFFSTNSPSTTGLSPIGVPSPSQASGYDEPLASSAPSSVPVPSRRPGKGDDKPYTCSEPDCGKKFTRTHDLDRHRKTAHAVGGEKG